MFEELQRELLVRVKIKAVSLDFTSIKVNAPGSINEHSWYSSNSER